MPRTYYIRRIRRTRDSRRWSSSTITSARNAFSETGKHIFYTFSVHIYINTKKLVTRNWKAPHGTRTDRVHYTWPRMTLISLFDYSFIRLCAFDSQPSGTGKTILYYLKTRDLFYNSNFFPPPLPPNPSKNEHGENILIYPGALKTIFYTSATL